MLIDELLALLDKTPVIADISPVSLCYLPEDVIVFSSAAEVALKLDDPNTTLPERWLITAWDPAFSGRFPSVRCDHDPFTSDLNQVLVNRFDDVASRVLCQSQLANRILDSAQQFDLIVFFLVDGLSYQDARHWNFAPIATGHVEPCLVDVPTLTRLAFPNIVGYPTVATRLFDLDFHNRHGFSYWTRDDNELTNRIFFGFPTVNRIGVFPMLLDALQQQLNEEGKGRTFVQIVRTGLDGYAHSQKGKPPVKEIVAGIRDDLENLIELIGQISSKKGWKSSVYLAADHGILWRHEFEPVVVGTAPAGASPRSCGWRDLGHQTEKGLQFIIGDEELYSLGYPKLRRSLRIDEQGVHGGISFQESVVPFVTIRIDSKC